MMLFGRDFLELQIRFAERAMAVTGVSLEDALFAYSPLATQFGVPFVDHHQGHPCWQRFLDLLHQHGTDDLVGTIDTCQQRLRPELRELMGYIRSMHPEARTVLGRSWLYNLAAYRRLYPPSFLATVTALPIMYTGLSLWGQFLDRHGRVKHEAGTHFLERIAAATTLEALNACFPLEILRAECRVVEFYRFYGLEECPPRS
jgi:hypothetical protein